MRILGLDPGTASFGFGILEKNPKNKYVAVHYGCIKTPSTDPMHERLKTIFEQLTQLVEQYQPNCVAIEKIYFMKNIKTAMSVSQARGIALLVAGQHNLPLAEFDPTQVKLAVCGYGRAEKSQMQKMVQLQLGMKEKPKPDDAADALAVALCRLLIKNAT